MANGISNIEIFPIHSFYEYIYEVYILIIVSQNGPKMVSTISL